MADSNNNRLILVEADGQTEKTISIPSGPHDVTVYNTTAAASTDVGVLIINIDTKTI